MDGQEQRTGTELGHQSGKDDCFSPKSGPRSFKQPGSITVTNDDTHCTAVLPLISCGKNELCWGCNDIRCSSEPSSGQLRGASLLPDGEVEMRVLFCNGRNGLKKICMV